MPKIKQFLGEIFYLGRTVAPKITKRPKQIE